MHQLFSSKWGTALVLSAAVFMLSRCAAESSSGPQLAPLQPNRSSELAASMRHLDAELVAIRTRITDGDGDWTGAALTEYDFNALAHTDSSMFVEGYTAFALAFHKRVADFNVAPGPDTYAGVVSGCTSCHQKACPGPLERIAKRELP